MIKDYSENDQKEMREILGNEDLWPHPLLPLKRKGETATGWPQFGVLRSKKANRLKEFLCKIASEEKTFDVELRAIFEPKTDNTVTLSYPTIEALLEDGWVVD